jgi:hexosaminidase
VPIHRTGSRGVSRGARRLLAVLALVCAGPLAASPPSVVPNPAELIAGEGTFAFNARTPIIVPAHDVAAWRAAHRLVELVRLSRGVELRFRAGRAADHAIVFARSRSTAPEGYALTVTDRRITILASDAAGFYYGAITLWQLVPADGSAVAAVAIRDAPAFRWRGLMLDSARHFQSPAFVRQFIVWMAFHKLNVLHWHLTDDQGWRLEINKYPRLTEVGAWRTPAGAAAARDLDPGTGQPRRYGGFYTQAEVRKIVAFAAERHVRIVPEIEMPGHALAAIVAYPELGSATNPPLAVGADWGIYPYLFNPEPATFTFLEDVLGEVIALFPGQYVHVGGDEAVKDEWRDSPAVQARARALGITDPEALQGYFTQQIGRYLHARGRRLIGWDEIQRPGLAADAVVMSWRGLEGAQSAARSGHDTILSPWPTLYFDNRQGDGSDEPPGRGHVLSLEDVYRFEPGVPGLDGRERRHVLGLQGSLWTEHIRTEARLAYMAFPRAAAVAELGWSPGARRGWSDFLRRLPPLFERYRLLGLPFADTAFAVIARTGEPSAAAIVPVELSNQAHSGDIRYTTDGSEPSSGSPSYATPLELPLGSSLRAATFLGGERVSRTLTHPLDVRSLTRRDSHHLELCSDALVLALEEDAPRDGPRAVLRLDIMNPCWVYRGVDLTAGARLVAAVAPLPFNFQIGDDARKIRVGDAHSASGELEARLDGCDGEPVATLPLAPAATSSAVTVLPAATLPARAGRHDVCLKFARPSLDPMWALDWVEVGE